MARQPPTDNSPGSSLFPEWSTLYDLIASEVESLTEAQLDFESEQWEWSKWSIRRQLQHMASVPVGWLVVHWGNVLFPDGRRRAGDFRSRTESGLPATVIMLELRQAIDLTRDVLAERSVGFLRGHTHVSEESPEWNQSVEWNLMVKAHPVGLTVTGDPPKTVWTLEATVRHVYFEEITHLYNIQRLKRAQGLQSVADLPRVGYWAVEGWDTSEPP